MIFVSSDQAEASELSESEIQKQLVTWLKYKGVAFSVGLEGAKRHPAEQARLKAQGMQRGHPDITLYLPEGRVVFVELKTLRGRVSEKQQARHDLLKHLGFEVHVIKAEHGGVAIDAVEQIIGSKGLETAGVVS